MGTVLSSAFQQPVAPAILAQVELAAPQPRCLRMSGSQLLAAPGLVGAHFPQGHGPVFFILTLVGGIPFATYLLGCCSGAATAFACSRARKEASLQSGAESPARRTQRQAEEGTKVSPFREGFLTGPRARKDGGNRR